MRIEGTESYMLATDEPKTMGIVLAYYRKRYGLSQKEVCDGICSIATLSRLEQGYREVDSLLGQALLGRIGKEITLFETILNEEDYNLWKIRQEIEISIEKKQLGKAEEKISEYRKVMPKEEKIHEQYCIFEEILIMIAQGRATGQILEFAKKGISITIGDWRKKRRVCLYNLIEVELLLILFHYSNSQNEMIEQELLNVLEFVMKYYSGKKREKLGIKIYLELIHNKKQKNDYEELLLYIQKALALINRGTGYAELADLYFLLGKTRERISVEKNGEWKKEECLQECKIAFHLYQIEQKKEQADEVIMFCKEKLQCQIIG
ncbi:MAG: helix-turn-helix domain-containing protein [Lachnospiraceae bacterium]